MKRLQKHTKIGKLALGISNISNTEFIYIHVTLVSSGILE